MKLAAFYEGARLEVSVESVATMAVELTRRPVARIVVECMEQSRKSATGLEKRALLNDQPLARRGTGSS